MHHDLGKVGDLDTDYYVPNDSNWHVQNRGEYFKRGEGLHYMTVTDRACWLLQHFNINVSEKEYIGIRLTDGLYEEANKSYLMSYTPGNCREHFTYQQNEKIALIALSERSDYLMDIDPNDDGIINILDLVLIVNMLLANEYSQIADINEDGELNILDIVKYIDIILNSYPL